MISLLMQMFAVVNVCFLTTSLAATPDLWNFFEHLEIS